MVKTLWITNTELPAMTPRHGHHAVVTDVWEGLHRLEERTFEAAVVLLPLCEWNPEALLTEMLRLDPFLPVIFASPAPQISEAVRLIKLGAHEYSASLQERDLSALAEQGAAMRRAWLPYQGWPDCSSQPEGWRRLMVGNSPGIRQVANVISLVGHRRSTVLITGETGTGKEVVARALHMASPRAGLPFIAVNCSALPENLLESELFGHVRGAFTGAIQNRMGRFEQAHRSTLFLDEIGDMPLELQSKLLRALQEREIQRLGSSEIIRVDVRVVAATNVDLLDRIRQGRFREDLYYRLNVVPISIPPLRERFSDVPLLVAHFLDRICAQEQIPRKQVSAETVTYLANYSWPGNVRELENRIEMAVALSGERQVLHAGDFGLPAARPLRPIPAGSAPFISLPEGGLDFEQTVGRIERTILQQALQKTGGNKKMAAEMLRLKRTTLAAKLKSLEAAAAG